MADGTLIEWTDATWNPITGCSVVDAGCTNCYAMQLAGTRLKHHESRAGLTRISGGRPKWTGVVRLNERWIDQPLRWTRPRRVFVCAHGDLFHESIPESWIDRVFAVMADPRAERHTFQVLTKRPDRAARYLAGKIGYTPLSNVWLGTSASDQKSADDRIPALLRAPARLHFLSAEPLLGRMDISPWLYGSFECAAECGFRSGEKSPPKVERCHACGEQGEIHGEFCPKCGAQDFGYVCPSCGGSVVQHHPDTPCLGWVIAGGESGTGARPLHPEAVRGLRDQCLGAGTPFFFKQWGEWSPVIAHGDFTGLGPAYPLEGCCANPSAHERQECLFWQDDDLVHWPDVLATPAFGARRIGKAAAGNLLDGQSFMAFPNLNGLLNQSHENVPHLPNSFGEVGR